MRAVLLSLFLLLFLQGMGQYKTISFSTVRLSDIVEGQVESINKRDTVMHGTVSFTKGFKHTIIEHGDVKLKFLRVGVIQKHEDSEGIIYWPVVGDKVANCFITFASNYDYMAYIYEGVYYVFYLDKASLAFHEEPMFDPKRKGKGRTLLRYGSGQTEHH